MESMLEILNNILKESDLETISKAELRKKYLEKVGLNKLPKEDKELFSSAVNVAYLNYVAGETEAVCNVDDTKNQVTYNNVLKEDGEEEKLIMNSCSDKDITPANINENAQAEFASGDDIEMESSNESDKKSLASCQSSLNDFKNKRVKRTLSSSSEDEIVITKSSKRSRVLKETKSSDSEAKVNSEDKRKISKNKKRFRKAEVLSSDSEDDPLAVLQKKSNSCNESLSSNNENDLSHDEGFLKYSNKQLIKAKDSEDESLMPISFKKANTTNGTKNNSSDSEDKPQLKYKSSIYAGDNSNSLIKKKLNSSNMCIKSTENSSDSENEPILTLTKKKMKSKSDTFISKDSSSESEEQPLVKYSKKRVNNSIDSDEELVTTSTKQSNSMKSLSDSEDEPLNKLNKKTKDSSNSKKLPVKREAKHSVKKPISNGHKYKQQALKKKIKRFVDSDDDVDIISSSKVDKTFNKQKKSILSYSSEDEPLASIMKNEPINCSDSEDQPLDKLCNKTNGFSDGSKERVKKTVKRETKLTSKKPAANSSKSKDQALTKKKEILSDSDDDNNSVDEEKEKSFDAPKNSPVSDSSEDEPLANISKKESKSSSDSENEPLSELSTKKLDKKRKSSGSGSSSFVDENDEHPDKKDKLSKKKGLNDSAKQGKKRPSASENKIEHLKKYVRVAGIRVQNYNKLFENCKTMKAKLEKLMHLLEKEGLKGRPTLEKCKKLRKKIETKREIAELDLSNILKEKGGRPKRSVCSDTTNCKSEEENSVPLKKFSRLKDIIDSEESD